MRGEKGILVLMLLVAGGCGDGKKEERGTPYGNVDEVRAYRERINEIIDEVNAVQSEVESTAVGSSGQATGENLAAAYERLGPRLRKALEELEGMEPPPLLAELHGEVRGVILLRLGGFDKVAEGWRVEQASSFAEAEPLYEEAEEKFSEANALIAQVNEELEEVDIALAEAEGENPVG